MKKLSNRIERTLMLLFPFLPLVTLITRSMTPDPYLGAKWFAIQTLIAGLVALLPAFVGTYVEKDVIHYEGGRRNNDPNPDREAVHELVKEGHRFPVRLPVAAVLLGATAILLFMRSVGLYTNASLTYKLAFMGIITVLDAMALYTCSTEICIWQELPGLIIGFLLFFGMALYVNFSKADNSAFNIMLGACALAYLFFGGVCLNRQSLIVGISAGSEERRAPARMLKRNRRIVLGFAAIVAAVSFLEPIRSAAKWCLNMLLKGLKWIAWLLRGGHAPEEGNVDALMAMQGGGPVAEEASQVAEEVEETVSSDSNLLVYIFLGIVGLGLVWIVFDALRKLMNKLSNWFEKFAHAMSEGFYDEKEQIMDAEEARRQLRERMKARIKDFFTREPSWESLTGREKARRLLKELYRKRGRAIRGIKALTAREAIDEMELSSSSEELKSAYDSARYSENEVDTQRMDALRKSIKP